MGVCLCTLVYAGVMGAPVGWASAPYRLSGAFAVFDDCPLSTPELYKCISGEFQGEVTVGKKNVPLTQAIRMQGGIDEENEAGNEPFIAAEDGVILSRTPQPVPGGLLGIIAPASLPSSPRDALERLVGQGATGVALTIELAAPAGAIGLSSFSLLLRKGIALSMPAKIRLSNPFLGEDCYIGSNAKPLKLEFTSGTTSPPPPNKPIVGRPGGPEVTEDGELVAVEGMMLVSNSFAVPQAQGCGGSSSTVIDAAIDAQLGLPSPAGHNTAVIGGTLEEATSGSVGGRL
jgi:hypothetical protein